MVETTSAEFCRVSNIVAAIGIVFNTAYKLVKDKEREVNEAVLSLYFMYHYLRLSTYSLESLLFW